MVEMVHNQEGSFNIRVCSSSGNALFYSTSYPSEAKAKELMNTLKEGVIFERKTNIEGKFVILVKTKTGKIIGQSNTYSSEAGMENGIKNLSKSLNSSQN